MSFLDELRAELLPFAPRRVSLTPPQLRTLNSLLKDGDTPDTFDETSSRYTVREAIPIIQLFYGVDKEAAILYRALMRRSVHQLQRLKQLLKEGDTPASFRIRDERYSYRECLEITHLLRGGLIEQAEESVRFLRGMKPLGLQYDESYLYEEDEEDEEGAQAL